MEAKAVGAVAASHYGGRRLAGRGLAPKSTGRTRWLEAPAPPIDEGGSTPCNPLRRSSPFPTLSSPKSRDRVGPLVRTSLRSTHRTARDATPVAWGLPVQPGSKRASRRAPMALRTARLAAADHRNGRRRCPQAPPVRQANRLAYLSRASRRKPYIPAVNA